MRYTTHNLDPVHRLHFGWTGWPKEGDVFPAEPTETFFADLENVWDGDGLTLLTRKWAENAVQFTFRVAPSVSPVFFTQRVKGRLQYALRQGDRRGGENKSVEFSRKVTMRALGENISDVVVAYIRNQLTHADLADPRYRASLARQAWEDTALNLANPTDTKSGRYWYDLHLVMVNDSRYRIGREDALPRMRDVVLDTSTANGFQLKALAVMPDHVHVALRGNLAMAPVEIGVVLQNALATAAGCRLVEDRFYVGTFGEYGLKAVRG